MMMQSRREGFAIPMAILLIGVITAGVVGAFARVESESSVVGSKDAQTAAYALAEAGMGEYLAYRSNAPNQLDYDLPGGVAEVRAELMRADDGVNGALYLIRSTGIVEAGGSIPAAQHTVAQLAWIKPYTLSVPAGWTSLSGVEKNGSSGLISGLDAGSCGTEGDKAGVAVPDSMWDMDGGNSPVIGYPDPIKEMGSVEEMRDAVPIDWDGIVRGEVVDFDVVINQDNIDTWQDEVNWEEWPVIYVDSSVVDFYPGKFNGKGTLIVRNNLHFKGGEEWTGVVMVGGKLVDNGTGSVDGAVVSGLNVKLKDEDGNYIGVDPGPSSRADGTKEYTYDSCAVQNALDGMTVVALMRNTWFDGWAGY